jgi:hypothetical protein
MKRGGMTVEKRLGLKIGDILLMAMILLFAIVLFLLPFFAEDATTAEIVIAESGEVKTIPLDKNQTYAITARGVTLTVCVEDGKVFVSHSDCRDGICRNTPPISRAGQTIVCAPAGVVVRVTGKEAVVDGVSG